MPVRVVGSSNRLGRSLVLKVQKPRFRISNESFESLNKLKTFIYISYPCDSVDDPALFTVENMVRRSFVTCTEQKTKIIVVDWILGKVKGELRRENLAPTFVKAVKERPVSARQVFETGKGARALHEDNTQLWNRTGLVIRETSYRTQER